LLKTNSVSNSVRIRLAKQIFDRYDKKQYSHIRGRNRCLVTGRGRSIFRFFKVSRLVFKKQASLGLFPGIKKFS
jgi:small subunit ribosomal protein S14